MSSFDEYISPVAGVIEEGTIIGREKIKMSGLTEDLEAAEVNGPTGTKGQYLWDGTYTVRLDRGISVTGVYHVCPAGSGGQSQRVLLWGEKVVVTWLNRNGSDIPVILDGCTIDFYYKNLLGKGNLIDFGEHILRSAICEKPEESSVPGKPFADNQYDNPNAAPKEGETDVFDQNNSKVIKNPGGEVFLDKFGRVISLGRHPDHEFLITHGKIDSGQDDVSDKTTIAAQDSYYDTVTTDESATADEQEPFSPKSLNLVQYQQKIESFHVVGDSDPTRRVARGILPRFDKWTFKPIVIRRYLSGSDGEKITTSHAVHQERGQTIGDTYGYVRTMTDSGDVKEFVPRHKNVRIVGDYLQSIGGNYEIKLKSPYMVSATESNPNNKIHQEYLSTGTIRFRLRSDENVAEGTAKFDKKITDDGSVELYVGSNGANSSSYKLKRVFDATTGNISIDSKGEIDIQSTKDIVIDSAGKVYLGGKLLAQHMVLGDSLKIYLDLLATALISWPPVIMDGGIALKTALAGFIAAHPIVNYLSSNQYVK